MEDIRVDACQATADFTVVMVCAIGGNFFELAREKAQNIHFQFTRYDLSKFNEKFILKLKLQDSNKLQPFRGGDFQWNRYPIKKNV